jgi:uridine kinase
MEPDGSIQKLLFQKEHPVIFITGFSGSGKTTEAGKLAARYPNTKIVATDWYLTYPTVERRRLIQEKAISEEPQTWYSFEEFARDVVLFQKTGRLSVSNAWDQKTGLKDLDIILDFNGAKGLIVCEGLYLLHPEIAKFADLVLLTELDIEEAHRRASERDSHRNTPEELAFKGYLRNTYDIPYFEKYRSNADIIL